MKRFKYLTLAALVAFAACDEGEIVVPPVPVTGTISGVVTIEGTGASGVTVTLSSGVTASTDGSGTYSFSGVAAGAYTVSISGFASDASFSASAKAATITTAGQVASVNFDGSYVRTSAILGNVSAGGVGLAGVSVSLSGQSSASTTTDANGTYSFSGLRAGSYTVSMTNPSSSTYSFTSTSSSITLGVGASQIVGFSGTLLSTSKVSGRLFIDENAKNDTFDGATFEDNLSVANVTVMIEGGSVNNNLTTVTNADGTYEFSGLAAGTYRVTLTTTSTALPSGVTFGGTNPQLVVVTTGATGTVNWPFDIKTQYIEVSGFLGIDGTKPGITPIAGWTIGLYDTQANAAAGGTTGRLGNKATGADGKSSFSFLRSADVSPNSTVTDQIVFARVAGPPTATHAMSGETIIEIKYNAKDSTGMAPDTFDALYNSAVIGILAEEIDNDPLSGWQVAMRQAPDTTGATTASGPTAANGWAFFTITPNVAFPDTVFMRLSTTQAGANGHGFMQAPAATRGTITGGQLKYVWDGTVGPNDTIRMGSERVQYTDVDVLFGVHHEKDDSFGLAPTFTKGDATTSVGAGSLVQLYNTTTGSAVVASAAVAPGSAGVPWKAWERPMFNLPVVGKTWQVRGRRVDVNLDVLNDTLVNFTLDGADQVDTIAPLKGSGGVSTFALKANNTSVTGTILSIDGVTPVASMRVNIVATAGNIQPNARGRDTTVVKTAVGGTYSMTGMREGPYTVTVQDSTGIWKFFTKLTTTTAQVSGTQKGGNPISNVDAVSGTRDNEGYASASVANFAADRMDTKVRGVVVNDRDSDKNTLDPDEALSGVTINLIDDADGDGAIDTGEATVATAITDITGAYSFSGLREDRYIVQAVSPSNATVLRALSGTGSVTNTVAVFTKAALGAGATLNQNNTRNVGNTSPPAQLDEFPRWSYATGAAASDTCFLGATGPNCVNLALTTAPANFVHLFNTGTIVGRVTAAAVGVAGVTVTITRCQTAAIAPSPPAIGSCTLKHGVPSPHIVNISTDASGNYSVTGLLEGVYQIDVAPQTGGYTNIVVPGAPGSYLATLVENNDIETAPNFVIS